MCVSENETRTPTLQESSQEATNPARLILTQQRLHFDAQTS
jgi:hypothetical protein